MITLSPTQAPHPKKKDTNMTDHKTFGELTDEEAAAIFLAHRRGEAIETLNAYNEWVKVSRPCWVYESVYRIKPEPPPHKHSIDWSHVAPQFKWMAEDEDGSAWIYDAPPSLDAEEWWREGDVVARVDDLFASYRPGTCDWKDSLVERDG